MASFFSHLECSVPCGAGPSDPRHLHQRCTCGAPLFARYDLTAARRVARSALAGREASMWRYREVLPLLQSAAKGLDLPVTLGEGWTPLVRARRLSTATGLTRIYIKDEARNPTGSWKARGLSAAVTRALHLGAKHIAVASGSRAAEAAATYSARAGLTAHLFLTGPTATEAEVERLSSFGAKVKTVDKPLDAAEHDVAVDSKKQGWCDVSAGAEPYRIEGQKTLGYEIAEQLGWDVPDWILCPSGSGTTVTALAKAFVEMAALGWIDPVRRPHIVAVQAAGCAPLVRAVAASVDHAERWQAVQTRAAELTVAAPPLGDLALRAIKSTSGTALGAGDLEMSRETAVIASLEGVSAAPGAGAALHAMRILVADGRIKPHDTVVVINPGN